MNDYWKNRKAGKRGQGERPVTERYLAEESKPPSARPKGMPRNLQPKVVVNNYKDPNETNHERVVRQRAKRVRGAAPPNNEGSV